MTGSSAARRDPPTRLTGGVWRTTSGEIPQKRATRTIPKIRVTVPPKNYCTLLAHGWDTFAETLTDLRISVETEADLDRAKAEADKSDERGAGLAAVQLGAELMQIAPHGGR